MSDSEEEIDGGLVAAEPMRASAPQQQDESDEEEIDSGGVGIGVKREEADNGDDDDEEEEEIDGGMVQADLFGPDSAGYQAATARPTWNPPAKSTGGAVTILRRGVKHAMPTTAPPAKRQLREAPAAKQSSAAPSGTGGSSVGERMMASMGYKAGGGLGKEEQGVTATIDAQSHIGRLGLGFEKGEGGEGKFKLTQAVAAPLGPEELEPLPKAQWMEPCARGPPDGATLKSWLAEGRRVESIDNEVEHCEEAILTAMLQRKSALDHIPPNDRRAFNDARTRANPFEGIKKEFFLNRAALKMAAMDAEIGRASCRERV